MQLTTQFSIGNIDFFPGQSNSYSNNEPMAAAHWTKNITIQYVTCYIQHSFLSSFSFSFIQCVVNHNRFYSLHCICILVLVICLIFFLCRKIKQLLVPCVYKLKAVIFKKAPIIREKVSANIMVFTANVLNCVCKYNFTMRLVPSIHIKIFWFEFDYKNM